MHSNIIISVEAAEIVRAKNISVSDIIRGLDVDSSPLFIHKEKNYICILAPRSNINSGFMVVDGRNADVFSTSGTPESLVNRLITAALSHLVHSVSIPYSWSPFTWDAHRRHMSFFAHSSAQGAGERVYMEREPDQIKAVFFYSVEVSAIDFGMAKYKKETFVEAQNVMLSALEALESSADLAPAAEDVGTGNAVSLALDFRAGSDHATHLEEWYESRLTKDQRKFVDSGTSKPIRLRGAAGTGKTLALCVKFLKDIERSQKDTKSLGRRFLFLAHSGSNKERILSTLLMLDERTGYLRGLGDSSINVSTLYELANEYMSPSYHTLNPIDLDAKEGRAFQKDIILDVIKKKKLRYQINFEEVISAYTRSKLSSGDEADLADFADRVNREFEHIIDAEGIRIGSEISERYIKGDHAYLRVGGWTEGDRRLILNIHDEYKRVLEQNNLISIDQLVADYSRYLDSHVWDSLRRIRGYDAIYVDEAHLFNNIEQMILPKIIKKDSRSVFVAFDLKQTAKEIGSSGSGASKIKIGSDDAEIIQLDQIFRFSREIAELIEAIVFETGAFNHLDDSDRGVGQSTFFSSSLPEVRLYGSDLELYNSVFQEAKTHCLTKSGRGKTAVICFDKRKYHIYANAGNYKSNFLAIETKEGLQDIRYIGKRFVYTEPEYIAGHQFERVYIVNVDSAVIAKAESPLERREMFARLYLSLTRSSEHLVICCSRDGGGVPEQINKVVIGGLARFVSK